MENPTSKIERVKLRGRETSTTLATVDDLIVHADGGQGSGGMVLEFVVWGANGEPLESFRITACPEDAARIRSQLRGG
jgi:hypothetical protein